MIAERGHDPLRLLVVDRGREDVDVADRLPHAAQRPGVGDPFGERAQRVDDAGRGVLRDIQPDPVGGHDGQAAQDPFLALGPEAREVPQPALLHGRFQVGDTGDVQLFRQLDGAFRAEARDFRELA